MSYRNDHDAALNRVAALERELAQLRGERVEAPRRIKPTRERGKLLGLVAVGAATLLCGVGLLWSASSKAREVRQEVELPELPDTTLLKQPIAISDEACDAQIEEWAVRDAKASDPRGGARKKADELMRGPIACGASGYATAEEQNVGSLISVYYETDPVALDGYSTAEQLWREWHRARAGRGVRERVVPKS